ncbi:hypothetical protein Lepto7376_2390 [[Leptolyngbya] sp. PCC 7376]|uniref:site-specific integrase n=1 Tax=[Leptolyngbya] sp. PCC 7376 TaxID=111781 RepID=UPI00029ED65F|nr:site-specific integrase [[Leptolyngbya] sp. PCC 7376]AFY38671.1 hypothetical protein Lepto7376_2390 [[Leptolyngbya] sp. PCC 7376]
MDKSIFKIGSISVYLSDANKQSYRIRWRAFDKQHSLTVTDLVAAQSIAIEINRDLSQSIYHTRDYYDPRKSIERQLIDEQYKDLNFLFCEWEKLEHDYAHTTLQNHKRVRDFIASLPKELRKLDNSHRFLEAYRSRYAESTIDRDLQVISACVNHWVKLGKVPHNPYPVIRGLLKPKKQQNKGRFTATEKDRILRRIGDGNVYRDLYQFLFMTGLRPEEAVPLTWGNFDNIKGLININKTYTACQLRRNTKQGKKDKIVTRKYRVNEGLKDFLFSLSEGVDVSEDSALIFPRVSSK